jgi:hypothetical protein
MFANYELRHIDISVPPFKRYGFLKFFSPKRVKNREEIVLQWGMPEV